MKAPKLISLRVVIAAVTPLCSCRVPLMGLVDVPPLTLDVLFSDRSFPSSNDLSWPVLQLIDGSLKIMEQRHVTWWVCQLKLVVPQALDSLIFPPLNSALVQPLAQ